MSEWISTKERLPKIDDLVLVHYRHFGWYAVGALMKEKDGRMIWDVEGREDPFEMVDYWMWFDEAPKGEDSDGTVN